MDWRHVRYSTYRRHFCTFIIDLCSRVLADTTASQIKKLNALDVLKSIISVFRWCLRNFRRSVLWRDQIQSSASHALVYFQHRLSTESVHVKSKVYEPDCAKPVHLVHRFMDEQNASVSTYQPCFLWSSLWQIGTLPVHNWVEPAQKAGRHQGNHGSECQAPQSN